MGLRAASSYIYERECTFNDPYCAPVFFSPSLSLAIGIPWIPRFFLVSNDKTKEIPLRGREACFNFQQGGAFNLWQIFLLCVCVCVCLSISQRRRGRARERGSADPPPREREEGAQTCTCEDLYEALGGAGCAIPQ